MKRVFFAKIVPMISVCFLGMVVGSHAGKIVSDGTAFQQVHFVAFALEGNLYVAQPYTPVGNETIYTLQQLHLEFYEDHGSWIWLVEVSRPPVSIEFDEPVVRYDGRFWKVTGIHFTPEPPPSYLLPFNIPGAVGGAGALLCVGVLYWKIQKSRKRGDR